MSMKLCIFACAVVVAAVVLSGCEPIRRLEEPASFLKVESTTIPAPEGVVVPPEKKTAICPDCAARMKGVTSSVVYRSAEVPALADIYFDYDKHAITPAAAGILRRNAEWFRANPGVKVRLEGHCDERGTGKYNVRLGQQRAKAAKSYLMRLGVSGRVLEVSTYGSEKPDSSEHNTQAWARNRKVHFAPLE
jgi:peptidoglycan-associated lipoprotein